MIKVIGLFVLFLSLFEFIATFGVFGSDLYHHRPPSNNPLYNGTILANSSDGTQFAYMIPPFSDNHASNIEIFPNGDLLIAWRAGPDQYNNYDIFTSRLFNGTTQWTNATLVTQTPFFTFGDPVLYYDSFTNTTHLFQAKVPTGDGETNSTIWEMQSTDYGLKWATSRLLFNTLGSYERNRIINFGVDWLFPLYLDPVSISDQYPFLEKTNNSGQTFSFHQYPNANRLVQPSIVNLNSSTEPTLVTFFRDRDSQNIYYSFSLDTYLEWESPQKSILPNNDAAIQAIMLQSGFIALVFNNCTSGRTPLAIALSDDQGITWKYSRNLEPTATTDASPFLSNDNDIEYSYPSLVQTTDGYIHISYTYNRETIKYVRVSENWIINGHF